MLGNSNVIQSVGNQASDTTILLNCMSNFANHTIQVLATVRDSSGQTNVLSAAMPLTAANTLSTTSISLGNLKLVGLQVISAVANEYGAAYFHSELFSLTFGGNFKRVLAGFLTPNQPLYYSGTENYRGNYDEDPAAQILTAFPGAGADWSIAPSFTYCRGLIHIKCTLATSAAVANRWPQFRVNMNGTANQLIVASAPAAVPASTTIEYHFANYPVLPTPSSVAQVFGALAGDFECGRSSSFSSLTANIQAGDQWSTVCVTGKFGKLQT